MTIPPITVLITTYNYGRFVEQAIDSVLSQDFPLDQVQIVVVDDGSTDDTSERVKKYGPRVEYFYKPNGGQASALNFGFSKARGEIIALLDADDFCLPGKLARIAEAFQKDPALGMVYHRLREWHTKTDTYTELAFLPVSGDIRTARDFFLSYVPYPTSAIAFRRSCLAPFLPIPEKIRMLADCFPVALMAFRAPVLAVPDFLTMYRIHEENSYYASDQDMPTDVRRARLRMWQIVISALRKWLADNSFSRKQVPARLFLDRWSLFQQTQRFLIKPPGRLRFFWFVVFENYAVSPVQTWKLTAFNYLSAPAALIFGYKKARLMYEWRGRKMAAVERAYRAVFGRRSS